MRRPVWWFLTKGPPKCCLGIKKRRLKVMAENGPLKNKLLLARRGRGSIIINMIRKHSNIEEGGWHNHQGTYHCSLNNLVFGTTTFC